VADLGLSLRITNTGISGCTSNLCQESGSYSCGAVLCCL